MLLNVLGIFPWLLGQYCSYLLIRHTEKQQNMANEWNKWMTNGVQYSYIRNLAWVTSVTRVFKFGEVGGW